MSATVQKVHSPHDVGRRAGRGRRHWWQDILGPRVAPYLFVSPFFIMFAIFWAYPVVQSFLLSFQHWTAKETTWVGMANFRYVLITPATRQAFLNMLWYAVVNNAFQLTLALTVAILMDLPFLRGPSGLLRMGYFMPNLVSGVTTAILFGILLGTGGIIDHLLAPLGVQIQWFQSTEWSKPAVILAGGWRWIGYWVVMFMAGLQGIPDDYYEVADMDGATLWQRFRYVTFPLLRPVFLFVIVVNTIGTLQIFEEPFLMLNGGGPMNSSTTPVVEMYKLAFQNFDLGSGAALGWLLAVVVIFATVLQFSTARQRGWSE